jgi:hypothetical protein
MVLTIDVAAEATITVTTGDVITNSQKTASMNATYLPHQR